MKAKLQAVPPIPEKQNIFEIDPNKIPFRVWEDLEDFTYRMEDQEDLLKMGMKPAKEDRVTLRGMREMLQKIFPHVTTEEFGDLPLPEMMDLLYKTLNSVKNASVPNVIGRSS